jgi:hypothetical protein
MEHASSFLYERQGEGTREREEELRTEMPTTALVRKAAASLGRNLDEGQASRLGVGTHYAFGAAGGPVAALLTNRGASPVGAGLAVAAAMELGADQGMNTVLGLTAPTWRFPLVTQVRALVAHLAYGLALGLLVAAGRKR